MKIFEDKKTSKLFHDLSEQFEGEKKSAFTQACKDAYIEKVTSIEDLKTYKLTEADVAALADKIQNNA